MPNINSVDKTVILQLSGCAYSSLSDSFADSLKYGRNTQNAYRDKLFLLNAYIEILQCYQPLVDGLVTEDDNCVTETEMQEIIENISKLTGVCFPVLGTSYTSAPTTVTTTNKIVYWGSSALTTLTDVQVQALQNLSSVSSANGTRIFNANDYKYYAYPASFGLMTSFIDTMTGFNVPMNTMFTVTIGGDTYNVHRTYYSIVSSLTIQIS